MTDPRALYRRLFEEGFTKADLDIIEELVSPDFVEHQFVPPGHPGRTIGPAGLKAIISELHRGAADFRLTIEDAVVDGDTVWGRLRATGTDTGGHLGRPPTGRAFAITVIDIIRFADGRAVEHWGVPDRFALLEQLGHLPGRPN